MFVSVPSVSTLTVAHDTERAFSVFTERFGDFKPPEHNLLAAPIEETVFEPRVCGTIYDCARPPRSHPGRGAGL
jgi:hypothetical protein